MDTESEFTTVGVEITHRPGASFDLALFQLLVDVRRVFAVYIPPIIVVIGLFGNAVAFRLLSLPQYGSSTTCVYIRAMTISDSMCLLMYALQRSLFLMFYEEFRSFRYFQAFCVSYYFWVNLSYNLSSYIVLAMSADRLYALVFPLQARATNTPGKARVISGTIFVVCILLHLPIQFFRRPHPRYVNAPCPFNFFMGFDVLYNVLSSVVGIYVPLVIISALNAAIVIVYKKSLKERQQLKEETSDSKGESKQITVMLLTVSLTFVLFHLPSTIQGTFWGGYQGQFTPIILAIRLLTLDATVVLLYCNYALNSYLYILPVKKFRKEVAELLKLPFWRK